MIVMYSTGCPRCNILIKKLGQLNETITIVEGEEEIEARGFTTAPLLEVDGKIMDFGAAVRWVNSRIKEKPLFESECESCNI